MNGTTAVIHCFCVGKKETTNFTMTAYGCKVPIWMEAPSIHSFVFSSSRLEESQKKKLLMSESTPRKTNLHRTVFHTYHRRIIIAMNSRRKLAQT